MGEGMSERVDCPEGPPLQPTISKLENQPDRVLRLVHDTTPTTPDVDVAKTLKPEQETPETRTEPILDSELLKVEIKENGEPLVDIRSEYPDIFVDIDDGISECANYVREVIAEKLSEAQEHLPDNYRLTLKYGFRLPEIQRRMRERVLDDLVKNNPEWEEDKILEEASKFVAPMELASHCAGAAVDVTLSDIDGRPYDMGCKMDEFGKKSYTRTEDISEEAKENREILVTAMEGVGFINCPSEWWHYSYGDTYWAAALGKDTAVYGPLDFSEDDLKETSDSQ